MGRGVVAVMMVIFCCGRIGRGGGSIVEQSGKVLVSGNLVRMSVSRVGGGWRDLQVAAEAAQCDG